ncbi:TerD family protein [Cognatiyoonia sp. IB215182]|uniref:TerD family protein n=1 Tax=Cognatiyoonia sp. IB215182 TaxID=3097353 RepID=UPI002A11AC0D|nr:TerD family protein [Cognatiyoonia sp. IB215182]MDX8351971.1 TerD family protein [Cognatiyoonia sp. IB215182]
MAISLSKGQTISLNEVGDNLRHIHVGVGWDPAIPKGLIGRLTGPKEIDLDASVITFDKKKEPTGIVYFGKLESPDGAIKHMGDNLTGDGRGDDEVIEVDLTRLDASTETLVFFVNSYQGHTFDEVDNAFCRVTDADSGMELCRYTLSNKGAHTGVVMATLSRDGDDWQIKAVGMPGVGRTADQLVPDALRHI